MVETEIEPWKHGPNQIQFFKILIMNYDRLKQENSYYQYKYNFFFLSFISIHKQYNIL